MRPQQYTRNPSRSTQRTPRTRAVPSVEYAEKNLSPDPPSVNSNPKRQITLVVELPAGAEGSASQVSAATLSAAADAQMGYTPANIVPQRVRAWAAAGTTVELRLAVPQSGGTDLFVVSTDNGGFVNRARCGIIIPPTRQVEKLSNTLTNVCSVFCTAPVTVYVSCMTWGSPSS